MNLQQIADTLEFDLEDIEMLMEIFLSDAKASLEKTNDLIVSNDFIEIKNIAHGIKGSASNLMLEEVVEIAQQIEQLAKTESSADYSAMFATLKTKLLKIEEMKVQTCV